jgi:hypothetical protein
MKKEYLIGLGLIGVLGYFIFRKNKKNVVETKPIINETSTQKTITKNYDTLAKNNATDLISKLPTESFVKSKYEFERKKFTIDKDKDFSNFGALSISSAVNIGLQQHLNLLNINESNEFKLLKKLNDSYGQIYLDFKNLSQYFPDSKYTNASNILKKYFLNLLYEENKFPLTNEEKVFAVENNLLFDDRTLSNYFPLTTNEIKMHKKLDFNKVIFKTK